MIYFNFISFVQCASSVLLDHWCPADEVAEGTQRAWAWGEKGGSDWGRRHEKSIDP